MVGLATGEVECFPHHHLDSLDGVVVRAGGHGVGERPQRLGRGVVEDQQTFHESECLKDVFARSIRFARST